MTDKCFVKGQSDNLPRVDALMIADYLANSECIVGAEMRGVKTQRASFESLGDSAVGLVQLKRLGNICFAKCNICPEHKVRSKQYSVTTEIDEYEEKILKAECLDCAAAPGGCKHAVAFIMWLHRRSEEPAPTTVDCYWKKSKLSAVGTSLKYITVHDFGAVCQVDTSENTDFLKEIVAVGTNQLTKLN